MSDISPFQKYYEPYPYRPGNEQWTTKKPKQEPVNIYSLFPNIDRWGIGYEPMFNLLEKMAISKQTAGFPPYNIVKNDDTYEITMALAGYKKDQFAITVEDRTLTVETVVSADEDEDEPEIEGKVIHQGIARRNFKSTFALGEYVEVKSAKFEDGLLTIKLELELPEEKKPRAIEVE